MIFVLGLPRSGTTWLAKIFDSHPDVIYRHEPDSVKSTHSFPFIVPLDEIERHVPAAQAYIRELVHVRKVKSVASPPVFHKSYHSTPQHLFREAFIQSVRVGERFGSAGKTVAKVNIPDFVDLTSFDAGRIVIKSVIAMGRARLFYAAEPNAKLVIILRHPCGQTASVLRGRKQGKLIGDVPIQTLSQSAEAANHGLDLKAFTAMDLVEQIAWNWLILNEKALTENPVSENVMVIRHEDLSRDPLAVSRELFEFASLSMPDQTESFVKASSSHGGSSGYFSVRRNSEAEIDKWKSEMAADDIDKISNIVAESLPGEYYF